MPIGFNYSYWRTRRNIPELKKMPNQGEWLPVKEASKKFGVSQQTIRHWYLSGKLEAVKLNGNGKRKKIYVNVLEKKF